MSRDSLFFSLFEEEHETALLTWIKWHIEILTNEGRLSNMKSALCGMKIKHKDGHTRRILMRQIAIEVLENSMPKTSIVTFDVITHLMKADFYWGRSAFGESENRQFHHLISTQQKDISNDIISDREKDVLRLIAQGRESKDIGKALFISLFTVENHRRNMLKRTGVRDTTALVQLCWMCGIL